MIFQTMISVRSNMIFQAMISDRSNSIRLRYERFTSTGYRNKGIYIFEFMTATRFLFSNPTLLSPLVFSLDNKVLHLGQF